YNECYIQAPPPKDVMYFTYLASCFHTAGALVCLVLPFVNHSEMDALNILGYFMFSGPLVSVLVIAYMGFREPFPIFNRQAQVVHTMFKGRVVHVPWRKVRPFVTIPVWRIIQFYSETQDVVRQYKQTTIYGIFQTPA